MAETVDSQRQPAKSGYKPLEEGSQETGEAEEEIAPSCLPCDEGDKSVFYSFNCDKRRRKCEYCGQKVCQYHFVPNAEGVVGGHSDCTAPPEASRKISHSATQDVGQQGSTSQMAKYMICASIFFLLIVLGGPLILWWRSAHAKHDQTAGEELESDADARPSWTVGAILWAVILCIATFMCGLGSFVFFAVSFAQAFQKRACPILFPREILQGGAEVVKARLGHLLTGETILVNFNVIAAACLSLIFSRPDGKTPLWLLVFCLPLIVRSKYIEWKLLDYYGGKLRPTKDGMSFVLSALDVYDTFSDGLVLPCVYYSDSEVHDKWIETFTSNKLWLVQSLAPAMDWLHIWRISAIFLFISLGQQTLVGCDTKGLKSCPTFGKEGLDQPGYGPESVQVAAAAHMSNFGALSSRFAKRASAEGRSGMVEVVIGMAKSFLENLPQGFISVTLLNLKKGNPLANPLVFLSSIASILGLLSQGFKLAIGAVHVTRRIAQEDTTSAIPIFFTFLPAGVTMLVAAVFLAVKLTMIFVCDTHSWELSRGCIDFD